MRSSGQPQVQARGRIVTTVKGALRLFPILALDAVVVVACYAGALALRFDGDVPGESIEFFGKVAPLIVAAYLIGNYFFRIYRTAWQYAGIMDAINLASSVGLVSIIIFGVNAFLSPRHIPLTVNVTAPALIFLSMGVTKLWPRLWVRSPFGAWGGPTKNLLVVGGGNTGQLLAREILQHPEWQYRPVGYVDDDPRKRGMRIHGLPVLGDRYAIPALVQKQGVNVVALAVPSASGATIRDLVDICQGAGVEVRTVPGLREIVQGEASPGQLREVTVDDLLGREQVEVDAALCSQCVRGRVVLVTGGAGYIGSELAQHLLAFGPAVVHLLDINETGLYDLQRDLTAGPSGTDVRLWIADVADRSQVERVFEAARPDLVFHAAAYKHIPVMEDHPDAAFRVNVLGTLNVCQAARAHGVSKFAFVSSDKAVNPDNVYGATKRIGELLVSALGTDGDTLFCAVRFGNVMGSRGSVVPLFQRQIERGGPVLLTHPEATRYFMSGPEAACLIIQAAGVARQGQIFILDMGDEVKIADLAEKLIRLKGREPGRDIKIVYTGLRAGDKLREELVSNRERLVATSHPKILLAEGQPECSAVELVAKIEELAAHLPQRREELAARLHALARIDLRDVEPAPVSRDLPA